MRYFASALMLVCALADICAVLAFPVFANAAEASSEPLAETQPLTWEGDLASRMVAGADRFLLGKLAQSVERRAAFWHRDLSSAGRGARYEVLAVRWPVMRRVHGEGLLLVPIGKPVVADIIVVPDADQTPEMLAGLSAGLPDTAQYARRLVESNCRVLIPALVDRELKPRNGRAVMTNREYLYRPAFELGRHLIGYETQKILALVDWLERDANGHESRIGIFGWGEGGMLALYAAALGWRGQTLNSVLLWWLRNTEFKALRRHPSSTLLHEPAGKAGAIRAIAVAVGIRIHDQMLVNIKRAIHELPQQRVAICGVALFEDLPAGVAVMRRGGGRDGIINFHDAAVPRVVRIIMSMLADRRRSKPIKRIPCKMGPIWNCGQISHR
ncbi:MAG: hypothetical protein NTX50_32590 [Candidatus Sumerlaeota bacterium]|nr:hypothetical protein [Candidatus Sumerlaeota bacterium]